MAAYQRCAGISLKEFLKSPLTTILCFYVLRGLSVVHTFDMLAKEPENQQFRAIFSEEVESLLRERAITTEQCAEIALTGLRAQLFYIPTQKYIFSDIQNRYKEMETSFHRLFS